MQVLYLNHHNQQIEWKWLKQSLFQTGGNERKFTLRIFSLVFFVLLGIFYSSPGYAVKPTRLNVTANPIYTASFSFSFGDFLSRSNVVPDRVYFNATGTIEASSKPVTYTAPYPEWDKNYSSSPWTSVRDQVTPSLYLNSMQVGQQLPGSTMTTPAKTIFLTNLNFFTNGISLSNYSSDSDLLIAPSSVTGPFTGSATANPHAMVISKHRLYFFWFENTDKLQMRSFNGSTFSSKVQFADSNIQPGLGVSGCLLTSGADEYVAITYAKSGTEVNIVTFKVPDFGNEDLPATTATATITVGTVDSTQVAIAQNPRTGKVFLNWIFNQQGYYRSFTFSPPGTFNPDVPAPPGFSSDIRNSLGVSVSGLSNFETSFALPKLSVNFVENSLLKNTVVQQELLNPRGYAVQFPYISAAGQKHIGMLTLSGTTLYFKQRLLHFPSQSAWDKSSKILHLQGPPWPGTLVGAEVDFGEVATTTSLAHAVNAAGGRKPFNGLTGVIASASTLYTVKFDRDMETGNYPTLIGSNRIRLLRPDNTSVPLLYVPGDSGNRDFSFRTNGVDLLFNTSYRITVASDVMDANGSQIWEAATMTFTTQANSSTVLASEVINIFAYRDFARTDSIASGSEVNATSTIYLRMQAVDPAFNTIDTSTVSVWRNGVQISLVNVTQDTASSQDFLGQYNILAPLSENSIFEFRTPQPGIYRPVRVDFPTFSPVLPASGAINVPITSNIVVKASEDISAAGINAVTVKLTVDGVDVPSVRSYNPGSREITINPDADMQSEKTYVVRISGLEDVTGNPQTATLTYQFTIADVTPPTIVLPTSPSDGATGVTIDRLLVVNFSEAILSTSATPTSVKLLRGGIPAVYAVNVSGSQMIIDPDDAPDGGLRTQTSYTLQIGPSVTDLSGNGLANVPATFSMIFTTQPTVTAPAAIDSLTLYKDALLIDGWGLHERLPASATIYMKVTGTDGATQTRDVATVALSLSWGPAFTIPANETASNSGGFYIGSFNLGSVPLYGVPNPPGPLPPTPVGSLTFSVQQAPANAATLTVSFPQQAAAQTTVNTLAGTIAASGATAVRIDSPLTISFSDKLADPGNAANLSISSGATIISGNRSLSADKTKITFTPDTDLPFSSLITVNGIYDSTGLKSPEGNPVYRPFNFSFTTQASQTQPLTASQVILFPDASYAPLSAYSLNQDMKQTGTVYIEVRGPDSSPLTTDYTMVSVTTGATIRLDETSVNSGIYRGFYNYPALADGFNFRVSANVNPAASQTLILTLPAVTPFQPASAAANVSIATRVTVKVSETLEAASVNASNVKLFKGATEISGTIAYLDAEKEIEFTPDAVLDFASTYRFSVSGVKDLAGNTQPAPLSFNFSTQAAALPPATINTLFLYPDNTYLGPAIASMAEVAPSSQIYVRVTAIDASPGTVDSTIVELTSNQTALVSQFTLIETAINSGVFQGAVTIYPEESAIISIRSQTDPGKLAQVLTFARPVINSLVPASATSNLYLDTIFTINTSKDVLAASLNSSTVILADSSGIASFVVALDSARVIKVYSELQPSSPVQLKISTGLKDTSGLSFDETIAAYSTLTPAYGPFRLYSNPGLTILLAAGSQVEAGQTVYARLNGTNAFFYGTETASAAFATTLSNASFNLTEVSAGIFTGSFVVPDEPGQMLSVIPRNLNALEQTLEILPDFALSSFSPASAALAIPADSWPTWNFTRPVRISDVNSSNFKLVRIFDSFAVPGTLTVSPTGKQVRFQPSTLLSLLTQYEMSVSQAVEDGSGNTLDSDVKTRFTTQPPPLPPTNLLSLKNFENSDFATSTIAVANDGTLHLELVAADTSFSTFDTARVRIDSSDGTIDGLELTLVEISPPSGIYRYSLPINLAPGASIRVRSQATPAFFIDITARLRTRLLSIFPASGTTGLFLDSPVTLSFSQAIDRTTAGNGLLMTASAANPIALNFTFSNSDKTIQIMPQSSYATATRHLLSLHTDLRDSNGLFLLPEAAFFTTRNATAGSFDLLTGIAPRDLQSVTRTHEVVRGTNTIVATTTDLFFSYPEYRVVRLTTATQTFDVSLSEISPGSFQGTFNFTATMPAAFNSSLRFASQPTLPFTLAALPQVLIIEPASGSSNISELPGIIATFSRTMAFNSAFGALTVTASSSTITATPMAPTVDSSSIKWNLSAPIPRQASCTLILSGITDYLGQPLPVYQHSFSTGGRQGINLYRDNAFVQIIATNQIEIPIGYVEVAASGSTNLSGRVFSLIARTGTRATESISLPLEPVSELSGRFRCSLEFDPARAQPQYALPLLPGEWLELSSPELTADRKLYYYRFSGSASPLRIDAIRFYAEKHFSQRISEVLANPTLFIEVEAEDLNWLTTDITQVRVSSEADRNGFIIDLRENGTHSSSFRNFVRIGKNASDPANQVLKVLPGQKIRVESITNPAIEESVLYLPENGIRVISVFPSPARGNNANFRFYLNFPTDVDLEIYDTAGDEVFSTVIRGQEGENRYKWTFPRKLANGVYFFELKIGNDTPYPTAKRKARGKFAVLR